MLFKQYLNTQCVTKGCHFYFDRNCGSSICGIWNR